MSSEHIEVNQYINRSQIKCVNSYTYTNWEQGKCWINALLGQSICYKIMPGINHGRFSCSFLREETACKREVFVSTSSILSLFLFLCTSIQQVLVICIRLSLLIFRARMSWTNSCSSFGTLMAGTDRKSRKTGKSEGYWCLWYVSSNAFHVFMIFETFRSLLMSFIDNLQIQSPNNVSRLHSCSCSLKGSQRKQDMTGLSFLPDSTMQNTKTVTLKWSSHLTLLALLLFLQLFITLVSAWIVVLSLLHFITVDGKQSGILQMCKEI